MLTDRACTVALKAPQRKSEIKKQSPQYQPLLLRLPDRPLSVLAQGNTYILLAGGGTSSLFGVGLLHPSASPTVCANIYSILFQLYSP